MMNFFKKLFLLFTYGDELEELLAEKKAQRIREELELRKDNLSLCARHQQRPGICADHNCDYCKKEQAFQQMLIRLSGYDKLQTQLDVENLPKNVKFSPDSFKK